MSNKRQEIMNTVVGSVCIFFLLIFLFGCSGKKIRSAEMLVKASLDAVAKKADRESVKDLIAIAECVSPSGKYSTEIHTASGGYSFFKQVYSYKPEAFTAIITNKDSGYIISDPLIALDKKTISVIRGHEFQNIILEIDSRYHDFETSEAIEVKGRELYWVKAKDELGNRCSLFFDPKTELLAVIQSQNPADTNEVIEIEFSDWQMQQKFLLPKHVEIRQGEKKYSFDYLKVMFNVPGFKQMSATKSDKPV